MDSMTQDTIIFGFLVALAAFVLWLVFRRRQLITQLQYHRIEMLNRAIDKFGSGEEFAAFLQSEQGKRLLQETGPAVAGPANGKKTGVLRYVQAAVILNVLGAAFMINAGNYTSSDLHNLQKAADLEYWGIMGLMLASGLYLVALITYIWNKWHSRAEVR